MGKSILKMIVAISALIILVSYATITFIFQSYEPNQTQVEEFNLEDALDEFAGISETYDDNSYFMHIRDIDLNFTIDLEQNSITLEDGTVLSFAKSVDIHNSNNWLGDWVGSTYSYLDVQSDQTNEELYELGIRDEVFDIGNEDVFPIGRAMRSGELECKFVSITIGKYQSIGYLYKVIDHYLIYYRHIDTSENKFEYFIYP